jgi:hypothetical protein
LAGFPRFTLTKGKRGGYQPLPPEAIDEARPLAAAFEAQARAVLEESVESLELRESLIAMLPEIIAYQAVLQRPSRERESIPIQVRRRVLAAGKCAICDSTERLVVDHIWPVAFAGSNEESNLQCLCAPCNAHKSYSLPANFGPKSGTSN